MATLTANFWNMPDWNGLRMNEKANFIYIDLVHADQKYSTLNKISHGLENSTNVQLVSIKITIYSYCIHTINIMALDINSLCL